MEWPTHQKWNDPKIINMLHTIINPKQKSYITKIIPAGNVQLLN
jgi:hypothetical protein